MAKTVPLLQVTPNLYGNIVANVVAGLTGGPGIMPGANVGNQVAVFEQGARHVGQDVSGPRNFLQCAKALQNCAASSMPIPAPFYLRLTSSPRRLENAVSLK